MNELYKIGASPETALFWCSMDVGVGNGVIVQIGWGEGEMRIAGLSRAGPGLKRRMEQMRLFGVFFDRLRV